MKRPTNKSEVRAILGLINYYGRFFKNLSDLLYPLNCLLQDKVPFHWNDECEKAFSLVKCRIQSDDVLCHFDSNLPITVASDASSYACGAVITDQNSAKVRTDRQRGVCYYFCHKEVLSIFIW